MQDRKTGQRFRLNGDQETCHMPEKECLRKDFTQYVKYTQSQLPPKVDLRPWMTDIENQSSISSWLVGYMHIYFKKKVSYSMNLLNTAIFFLENICYFQYGKRHGWSL